MLWVGQYATVTLHNTVTSHDTADRVDLGGGIWQRVATHLTDHPPVFGFATNKKLISLQSQERLIRTSAQLFV